MARILLAGLIAGIVVFCWGAVTHMVLPLGMVGFRPELNECLIGHEPVMPEDQFISYHDGGVVCARHATRNAHLVPISMLTLKVLRHMQRSPYQKVKALKVTPSLHDDIERILLGYLSQILERRLQSVDFIRQVRQYDK